MTPKSDTPLTGISKGEHARRKRVRRRTDLVTVLANTLGAILASFFFTIRGSAFFSTITMNSPFLQSLLFLLLPAALIIGGQIGTRMERPMWQWYLQGRPTAAPSRKVQQLALNVPLRTAAISFAMWGGVGLAMALLFVLAHEQGLVSGLRNFDPVLPLGMAGIVGPITALILYFATERIWQREIPLFFPEGLPRDVSAFRLTLRKRLFVPFMMGGVLLIILAIIAYTSTLQIVRSSEPALLLRALLVEEIFVVSVGILVAVALAATLGTSIAERIEQLQERMTAVQEGDLDVRLPVLSNDEFGDLAAGFNAMVSGLRQEEVIRQLFNLYVTPEVATHAIAHGAELGGQLTHATLLFSDIRGFTSMTEQMDPQALIALLNRYFAAMSHVVREHGGLVNKFGGDSLLAVFGSPLNPQEEHGLRAVRAAQRMVQALETFNVDQRCRGEPELGIGVGIATGRVVAGNVGSRERLEYTVIGDAVNVASRLQGMTRRLDALVLLDEETAKRVRGQLTVDPRGAVEVRGKKQPVSLYALHLEEGEGTDQGAEVRLSA